MINHPKFSDRASSFPLVSSLSRADETVACTQLRLMKLSPRNYDFREDGVGSTLLTRTKSPCNSVTEERGRKGRECLERWLVMTD